MGARILIAAFAQRGIRGARDLLIAGGGCGGSSTALAGSGAGAGGMRARANGVRLYPGQYTVTIGLGATVTGANGGDSSVVRVANGQVVQSCTGGGGGRNGGGGNGVAGGSGGGGGNGGANPGGSGIPGEGNNGGAATSGGSAGGGGGAGSAGTTGLAGNGLANNITGSSVTYCAGGQPFGASAGATPGSGGGGRTASDPGAGGAGANGRYFLRYAGAPRASGGTITTVGSDTLHTFTTSGVLTVF